jgi:hypothetical protein
MCAISINLCILVHDPGPSTDALWTLKMRGRHIASLIIELENFFFSWSWAFHVKHNKLLLTTPKYFYSLP